MQKHIRFYHKEVTIHLLIGDISTLNSEAIVNSANKYLIKGGGVCGSIFAKAGDELGKECTKIIQDRGKDMEVGEAVATDGYCLKAKYIIHVLAPRCAFKWNQTIEEGFLKSYQAIFEQVNLLKVASVGIPLLGTGAFHCDPHKASAVAVKSVLEFINTMPWHIKYIIFVLNNEQMMKILTNQFKNIGLIDNHEMDK